MLKISFHFVRINNLQHILRVEFHTLFYAVAAAKDQIEFNRMFKVRYNMDGSTFMDLAE
jgi:hypothetical protein